MNRRLLLLGALAVAFLAIVVVERSSIRMGISNALAKTVKGEDRVGKARERLKDTLPKLFTDQGVAWPPHDLFLRAIKQNEDESNGVVELWAKEKKQAAYTLIKSYPICALSGTLGPKRKQGDMQIPEGFYTISALNPVSSFHLSMRVDYPNQSDKIRGRRTSSRGADPKVDLGGDIMVHGNCVTIGCIPLEDEPIEEVYLAAASVFGKRPLPLHIFPRRLDDEGLQKLLASTDDKALHAFWTELAAGYQAFEDKKVPPKVTVAKDGAYVVDGK